MSLQINNLEYLIFRHCLSISVALLGRCPFLRCDCWLLLRKMGIFSFLLYLTFFPSHFCLVDRKKGCNKMMEHQHSLEANGGHNTLFVEQHSSFCLSDLSPFCFLSMQHSVIFITESSLGQTAILSKVQSDILLKMTCLFNVNKKDPNEKICCVP